MCVWNRPQGTPLSLAYSFFQWPLTVLQRKNPLQPKNHFPHRPPLYNTSVKLLTGHPELQIRSIMTFLLWIFDLWRFYIFKMIYGPSKNSRVGSARGTLLHIFSGPHTPEVNPEACVCTCWQLSLDWIGALLVYLWCIQSIIIVRKTGQMSPTSQVTYTNMHSHTTRDQGKGRWGCHP